MAGQLVYWPIMGRKRNHMDSLDHQREAFSRNRFIAMPIAGALAWLTVGIGSLFLDLQYSIFLLFGMTGMIVYFGLFISKFTGENFMDKARPKNAFDSFFFHTVAQAVLVYSIAIPFFLVDPTSLPLSVGILTGLMWVPLSWAINHWIGYFHTGVRTAAILLLHYAFPEQRFLLIPLAIVAVYAVTIIVLEQRFRRINASTV